MPRTKNSAVAVLITTPIAATNTMVLPAGATGSTKRESASQAIAPTASMSNSPLNNEAMMVAREKP